MVFNGKRKKGQSLGHRKRTRHGTTRARTPVTQNNDHDASDERGQSTVQHSDSERYDMETELESDKDRCNTETTCENDGLDFESDGSCFSNDTYLYSEGPSDNCFSCESETDDPDVDKITNTKHLVDVLLKALHVLAQKNLSKELVTFLELIAGEQFPLENVAFQLFLDVVRWFSCTDVRSMRYNETTLKFFWLGKHLFGSKFLRFMSGPKNETDLILGKTVLNSSDSKINFACPSDTILNNFNPLGYDVKAEASPGIMKPMIDMISRKSSKDASYIITFDGKKVKRGGDVNLLGFEDEPVAEKRNLLAEDTEVVDRVLTITKQINRHLDTGEESDLIDEHKTSLKGPLSTCFSVITRNLRELRKMRVNKSLALKRYKERIAKDPALLKSLEYAMDSCRTSILQIDNCISDLMDSQWQVCRTMAYLNGSLHLFARSKTICLANQPNVALLKPVEEMQQELDTEVLPTELVKQRSHEWFDARKKHKATGSTIFAAVGCDGLKRQKEHFDLVSVNTSEKNNSSGIPSTVPNKAMQHGIDSEKHEIATLSSIVLPALWPSLKYREEGYYEMDNVMVSPDGSVRNIDNDVDFAFEGKAPTGNEFNTVQHYKVPERYITQTVLEQNVLNAKLGTLYLCWTSESTTVFIVPASESLYHQSINIVDNIYFQKVPKRPTRLTKEAKDLKTNIKKHASECILVGEFPSVLDGTTCSDEVGENEADFSYSEISKSLMKSRNALKQAFQLKRHNASQVLVYLVSDLDRLWKPELPHAVPVMYCYRGYSLSMDIARNLLQTCRKACLERGLDVIATSSDGEFIQLMNRDSEGKPLTEYQLSKAVWAEVCKMKKHELINNFKVLNRGHKVEEHIQGQVTLSSIDGGSRVKTPNHGWKKPSTIDVTNDVSNSEVSVDLQERDEAGTICEPHTENLNDRNSQRDLEQDEASGVPLTASTSVSSPVNMQQTLLEHLNESENGELLEILVSIRPQRWKEKSIDDMKDVLENNLPKLTKVELAKIAKFINQKLQPEEKIRVSNVNKAELVKKLSPCVCENIEKDQRQRKLARQPKSLQKLAVAILQKPKYPKHVLNIAYATFKWPEKLKAWREQGRVSKTVHIRGKDNEMSFEPFYIPEFDKEIEEFRVFTYDKTHLGTNLRKCLCLDKVKGVSVNAWKEVARSHPELLHPSIVEVSDDGKIMDQMKETLAKTMVCEEVEKEMRNMNYVTEADVCSNIREGLYIADDVPGIPAWERCCKRISLIKWLKEDVDFGVFPPYGGSIKGMSNILYEGLRSSQESKLYLYALAKSGTYCVRAANTLCSESFFGTMQEMDPWGQGILSTDGINKHMSDFAVVTAMKLDTERNMYIQTKKKAVYPAPDMRIHPSLNICHQAAPSCDCRKNKFLECVVPRDHFFDTPLRARLYKGEKPYRLNMGTGPLRGELPIRAQYGYKINESRMLPSKRLAVHNSEEEDSVNYS